MNHYPSNSLPKEASFSIWSTMDLILGTPNRRTALDDKHVQFFAPSHDDNYTLVMVSSVATSVHIARMYHIQSQSLPMLDKTNS